MLAGDWTVLTARRPFAKPCQKTIARGDLAGRDELIRLVCLLDAARPTNHRSHAGSCVLTGLGAVGNAVRFALRTQLPSEALCNAARARVERGRARRLTSLDAQDVEAIFETFAQTRVDARACVL